jgi:hypothetical protein
MDVTPNRSYPFSECDPPLVKDASDIGQLRDLALAVDADVQGLYDEASELLIRPDACRMSMSASVAGTSPSTFPFFDIFTFDNSPGGVMSDTANGVIQIVEPGWYSVGTWTQAITTTFLGMRARFLQGGSPATTWSPQAGLVTTDDQYIQYDMTLFFDVPASLTVELKIGAAAPVFTYATRIWAVQVAKL